MAQRGTKGLTGAVSEGVGREGGRKKGGSEKREERGKWEKRRKGEVGREKRGRWKCKKGEGGRKGEEMEVEINIGSKGRRKGENDEERIKERG